MTAAACAEATGRSPSSSATASAPASSGESGGLPKAAQGLCPAENRDVTGVPSEVNARLVLVTITPVGLEAENQGRTSSTSAALAIARTAGCPRRQSRQQRGRQGEHTPCRPAPRRCSARSVSVGRLPSWSRLPTPPHTPPSRMPDPEPPTDAERHPPPGPTGIRKITVLDLAILAARHPLGITSEHPSGGRTPALRCPCAQLAPDCLGSRSVWAPVRCWLRQALVW